MTTMPPTAPSSGVRIATVGDADQIGAINQRSWRDRLRGILPDPALETLSPDDLAMVWAGSLLNPPSSGHRVLVAHENEDIVGYAAIGPSTDPDAVDTEGELLALEVDPGHQRSGHGSRLLAAAVDHSRLLGWEGLHAWVPLTDERRRSFLQETGWGPDSAYRDLELPSSPDQIPDQIHDQPLLREVRLVTDIREP